jgi:hypothetical protein
VDRDVRLVVQAMRVCLVAAVIFVLFVIVAAPRVFPHGPLPHGDGACVRTGAVVECAIP